MEHYQILLPCRIAMTSHDNEFSTTQILFKNAFNGTGPELQIFYSSN